MKVMVFLGSESDFDAVEDGIAMSWMGCPSSS